MFEICMKYFYIVLCGFYLYTKLLNIKIRTKNHIAHGISSIILAIIIYFVRLYFLPESTLILIILFIITTFIIYKESINITIVSSLISLGCSYVLFMLSLVVTFPFTLLFTQTIRDTAILYDISLLVIGSFELILCTIPFRFKRLKNGMPFLRQQGASDIGVYIAISLLMATSFFTVIAENNVYFLIPVFFIFVCGIIIFFWWKNKLTENYLQKIKEREINALQEEINQLKLYNETLSKIIHKDNKLIPAMELSVKNALSEIVDKSNPNEQENLLNILSQLEDLSKERKGILHICDNQSKGSYSTGVPSIDNLLQYFSARAYAEQTNFEVMISQRLQTIIPNIISEVDFRTLVADMVENALIAVKNEPHRSVLLHTRMEHEIFCIDFYDSGVFFDEDVLAHLGQQRVTTHKDEGGTGIGFMSTFEILERCNASLVIDETLAMETYKKKIEIRFDSLGKYQTYPKRT